MIRSTQDQLADFRAATDSGYAVVHIDTCLPCYLQDHHNRDGELLLGVPVDGRHLVEDVLDALESEFHAIAYDLGEYRAGYDHDKARKALQDHRDDNEERLGRVFDLSLEIPNEDDDEDGESVVAYFLITWDVPDADD